MCSCRATWCLLKSSTRFTTPSTITAPMSSSAATLLAPPLTITTSSLPPITYYCVPFLFIFLFSFFTSISHFHASILVCRRNFWTLEPKVAIYLVCFFTLQWYRFWEFCLCQYRLWFLSSFWLSFSIWGPLNFTSLKF